MIEVRSEKSLLRFRTQSQTPSKGRLLCEHCLLVKFKGRQTVLFPTQAFSAEIVSYKSLKTKKSRFVLNVKKNIRFSIFTMVIFYNSRATIVEYNQGIYIINAKRVLLVFYLISLNLFLIFTPNQIKCKIKWVQIFFSYICACQNDYCA